MTNCEYVKKLQKKKTELIKICRYFNITGYDCDDIIQDLYLTLLTIDYIDRYVMDNEPNMYIIFTILKNLIYHFRKGESKYIRGEIFDMSEEELENEKYEFIINEIDNMDDKKENEWFEKKIIELYILENHTIRSLSKETKIGTNVIQPIIRNFKLRCLEKYRKSKK